MKEVNMEKRQKTYGKQRAEQMIWKKAEHMILAQRFLSAYRNHTMAIFLSFALTFLLMTTLLVLLHTNHRIENIQAKTLLTPSDCRLSELSAQQVELLEQDTEIDELALEQVSYTRYARNGKSLYWQRGNDTMITMMSKVKKGRLPQKGHEIAAENWILLNLGIEPVLGKKFYLQNEETKENEEVELVGILMDMPVNKKYGVMMVYSAMGKLEKKASYTAYVHFRETVHADRKIKGLSQELGIRKKQVKKCPAREDFQELYCLDVQVVGVVLVICMVVFYGIFRISLISRKKQYGILRAVGMQKMQLIRMMLEELYQIYLVSVPVGIAAGIFLSGWIMKISRDRDSVVYLYNESISFYPVIPIPQILYGVLIMAVFTGMTGYLAGRNLLKQAVVEIIAGVDKQKAGRMRFSFGMSGGKQKTLYLLGCKYLFRDIKMSLFLILTICSGIVLFTGLAYKAQTLGIYREDTREMWYLNGQYEMSLLGFDETEDGISRESAERIKQTQGVSSMKTAAGMPVRVLDEGQKRKDEYYDELNRRLMEFYGYAKAGNDGNDQVYQSILYGYNTEALKELKKYVILGDFDPEHIKEDEIILSVLYMDDTGQNENPGFYKEGTPLMDYRPGDQLKIKYRADFETGTAAYEKMEDADAEYIYKTYQVAAIVSFPYMYDCNRNVYPLLITGDSRLRKIAPESCFQCIYIDGDPSMTADQQEELEKKLIQISAEHEDVATRSLISEIRQNEMFYKKQMVNVYGIAVTAFLLVFIYIRNNLRYRMQVRTREICMLRAVGMSVAMVKRMFLYENGMLFLIAVFAAYPISYPVLKYLYQQSDMRAFSHEFHYNYTAFSAVAIGSLMLCILLSNHIGKLWKTKRILEAMEKADSTK